MMRPVVRLERIPVGVIWPIARTPLEIGELAHSESKKAHRPFGNKL